MFNKSKIEDSKDSSIIEQLNKRIIELETQLNKVANDNGSIIVKQLPNGKIELNGVEMDNTTEVEYYNSSQATYGELTMFRIGKEAKQREMDKLTAIHMDEVDRLNMKIANLEQDIVMLTNKSIIDNDTIKMHEECEYKLESQINDLKDQNETDKKIADAEKQQLIERYEGMISGLEEDIVSWKERYLKINNITLDGTIITKYGKILGE